MISNLIELKNRPLNSESFSAFFAAIPLPTFAFVGEDLVLIDFNDAIEKLSFEGVSLGIKASELFKDDGRILKNLFSCLHEKSNFSEECEYRMKKTGEQKKFSTSFIFIQPDLVILHIEDLTRQNKVNKALQEARDVLTGLQLIINQSPAVVFLVRDEEGWPVEYITDNIRQFGYETSDFNSYNLKFTDIIHPDDLDSVVTEAYLKCQNSAAEFVQEYRIVSKLGEHRWTNVRTWVKRNREDTITHFQGIILDITERREAEEKLKESENFLRERVKELTCLYGLSKLFEKPGASIDEIIQGTLVLIPPAMQFPEVICTRIIFNEKEYKTVNFKETKWEITRKSKFDGKLIEIQVYYLEENLFLKEELSLIHEIVNRLKSIIEYKIILEELVRKEKLATIGTLIGSIGHELRNPLGVISNSVYFLNHKIKKKEEKVEKHLNILQKEVDKASKFISSLLDFIRIRTPSFKEGDINKAIENVVKELVIPENISLERNLDVELPRIQFDLSQMKQVFHNLILNAIQAMPDGGILEIQTLSREDFIYIRIKDSGIGISEGDFDKIFEPLFTTKVIGIGLGLTIVKDILEKHNGTVEAMGNIGGGTIFILKLPLKEGEL